MMKRRKFKLIEEKFEKVEKKVKLDKRRKDDLEVYRKEIDRLVAIKDPEVLRSEIEKLDIKTLRILERMLNQSEIFKTLFLII